ncbi:hypothetical protein M9Y10_011694 [Tritrichomonas musculus]|uniref:HECT domain-containing protein n=1 Tax=Tritrichomonas musculus TaxID=1915356 RepID=A0ABR2IKV0_9EUKA
MARVHLDVKFPFDKIQNMMMRFGKKSNREDICDQLVEHFHDRTFQNAEIAICQGNGIKVWMKKDSTLKSLSVESDMSLFVYRNPIRYNFEYNNKGYETFFSPKQTILQIVPCVAESASILYYLGFSLIPVYQGKTIPITEDLLLCDQLQQFDKILFRIKYYTILPGDMENGVPLSRTYFLTRDYLLAGYSPLTRKEYINLCAMVSVIELGDDLDRYLLNFDSAYFVRYLPQKLKTDLNSEDDLFDQIQILAKDVPSFLKQKFVNACRSCPNFGYQSFDVQYSVDNSELEYIFCCVGYNGIIFLNKKDLSCIDRLDLENLSYEIDIEGVDKLILNEKYHIIAYSDQILEIESLIRGYKTLKAKLSKIQKLDSKLESIVYNYTIENDLNFLLKIPESITKVVTPTIEFYFASQIFEKMTSQFNFATIDSIGDLYFVSSDKRPDFGDLVLPTGLNLKEKGKFLLDLLGIISLEIRSGTTSLFDLAQKYGNELRSTLFIVHMMKKEGIDSTLCDDIMLSYKVISTNLRVEITISKLRGLCVPFSFPSFAYEQILKQSKSLLINIKKSQETENNTDYIKLYKDLYSIVEDVSNIFTEFLNNTDPLKSYDDPKFIKDLMDKISYFTPIFSLINEQVSLELSSSLQYLDSIRVIQSVFPKVPFKVYDLPYTFETIIRSSDDFYHSITDIQMRSRLFFLYDMISLLEGLTPKINQHFIQKSKYDEMIKILVKYYSDLLLLKIDPGDENAIKYVMACYSTLHTLWVLRMIPSQFIYEDKEPTNDDKVKKNKPKIPRVHLPKSILPEDEVDISKEFVEKLNLTMSEETNSSVNLQEFLDDISNMDSKIVSIISLLEKWQPLIQTANRSDPLFDTCRKNYEFALKIVKANAERQSRYQPISFLFIKIKHHVQFVKCKAVDKFNKAIFGISEKSFEEYQNVDKLPAFKTLLNEVQKLPDQDIYTRSLIIVLQKFIYYFEPLTKEKFSVPEIVDSINHTISLYNQIFVKLICSQYDENLNTVLLTLVFKIMDLLDIKKDIIKKVLKPNSVLKYSKKAIEISKRIVSLSFTIMDKVFKKDAETFYLSLAKTCWKIIHAKTEASHHARLTSLLTDASEQMKKMAEILQEKMFKGNSIPQDIILLLKQRSIDILKYDNANLLITLLNDISMLYEKQKFWDIVPQLRLLLTTLELAVGRMIQKPYVHIFSQQNSPGLQILLQSTFESSDSESNLSTGSSNMSSDHSDSRFSSSDDSSSNPHSEYVSPSYAMNAKRGRQLNIRSMSTLSNFSNSLIRISQSDPNLNNLARPGILVDPIKQPQKGKQRHHVTFDLCKDQDSPIFSTLSPPVVDSSIPPEFIPAPSQKRFNFLSWNLPDFIKKINVPDKLPKIKIKKKKYKKGKKERINRFESFSHLTFDMLRLPPYKENSVTNSSNIFGSYGSFLYSYQTAEKAIEDIELLLTQCQTCENMFRKMRNTSISERLFFILDWLSMITTIPMKISAAKKYDIPQAIQLLEVYTSIRSELNMIIDDLKIPEFQTIIGAIQLLLLYLDLTKFALQKAENDLVQVDLNLKDVVSSWKIYTEDVYDTFQQMIEIDEPIVLIFMRTFVESVFNSFVKFGAYADDIDRETKRQIMTVIQCQLCVQLRVILTSIKKMDLRECSSITQIQIDAEALMQKVEKNEFFTDLFRILKELNEAFKKRFLFADADWYSLQMKHFIESKIGEFERFYITDPDSEEVLILYQIMSLRHNLISMRFTTVQTGQTTFMVQVKSVIQNLRKLNNEFSYAQSMKDDVSTRKIVEKWNFFFNNVEDELNEISSVAILMLNSSIRLKTALKYLKKTGVEIVKIERSDFPLNVMNSYKIFAQDYTLLIDYVLNKLNAGHSNLDDMKLDYDTVSQMPSVKVTPFVNSYKNYSSKNDEYVKNRDPNSEYVLLPKLFLTQLKAFSRKFGGSYMSIHETIETIASTMEEVIPKISKMKFNETFSEQESKLNLLRMKDDYPICGGEIKILQVIVQIGELVVAIVSFNLDFFYSSTNNSKLLTQLIKDCGINIDYSFIKNGLSFKGNYDIITKQLELFKNIKIKANEALLIENPFDFSKSDFAKLNAIQINEIPNYASISSVVKAHDYIISKFTSLFFFNSNSRFIKELKKFATNASKYFGYYHMQQNIVLLDRTNQIVQAMNDLFKSFDNLSQFRKLFFFVIESAETLKKRLIETAEIEKEDSKALKIDKALNYICQAAETLRKTKSKSVFGPLFDFIMSLTKMTRLNLRLMFDYHDMLSFLFALTNLVEDSDVVQVKRLQLLLQILMKINLPSAEIVCDKIANFIDNYVG